MFFVASRSSLCIGWRNILWTKKKLYAKSLRSEQKFAELRGILKAKVITNWVTVISGAGISRANLWEVFWKHYKRRSSTATVLSAIVSYCPPTSRYSAESGAVDKQSSHPGDATVTTYYHGLFFSTTPWSNYLFWK